MNVSINKVPKGSDAHNGGEELCLPALALRGLVIFPGMLVHFDVAREKSILAINDAMDHDQKIFLTAQRDVAIDDPEQKDLYNTGVVAEIRQVLKLQGDTQRILVEGLYRARMQDLESVDPFFMARVTPWPLKEGKKRDTALQEALLRTLKVKFEEYCLLSPKMPKEIIVNIMTNEDPVALVEYMAGNLMLQAADKQYILEQTDPMLRMRELVEILQDEIDVLTIEKDISEKVRAQIDDNQREYYLREQMKVISAELGDTENVADEIEGYQKRITALGLQPENEEKLMQEADRLAKLPAGSHEGGVIRNYLDVCLELPWNKRSKEKLDLKRAEKVLDRDHYGMQKVKERILEFVAVKKLAPDIKGQIICLEGPPGVGKTSIAKSLAQALGRKYVRISLGGIKDESEIRGHRKTYIGSMPGRIIDAVKNAGVKNPLILLDEIDKMSNDFRGDPSSAMLEVLDAEQNVSFRDHYIELPFDMSEVLFITTANDPTAIPAPLLDRMEVISLSSYTRQEKFMIAKKHLYAKQLKKHGLSHKSLKVADDVFYAMIDFYTREAGVRKLERSIASVCRKAAKSIAEGKTEKATVKSSDLHTYLGAPKYKLEQLPKNDPVGIVTGLAWTSVGGETLEIEVQALEGDGKLQLTGSLGDVMQESAKTAISYVRGVAEQYGIAPDFYKKTDIHIHAPEGAVPKDGPSAGVTMVTAIISELAQIPVRREVAMTGEVTLKGRVLAIGGLKEKSMAAYRMGITTVIIPEENLSDLEEIDTVVKDAVQFVPAENVKTVLQHALLYPEVQISVSNEKTRKVAKLNSRNEEKTEYIKQ